MYKCQNCWYTSATKLGRCPSCGQFWTFVEVENKVSKIKASKKQLKRWNILQFDESKSNIQYFKLSEPEIKRILTKWIKRWWIYLLWGEPWIWKSTIILQIIDDLLKNNPGLKIWYFSWEENIDQILERKKRIIEYKGSKELWDIWREKESPKKFWKSFEENKEEDNKNFQTFSDNFSPTFHVYHATVLEDILTTIEVEKFDFVVFDSIQTIYSQQLDSPAWSVSQVKLVSEKISEFCKRQGIACFIIWHVTKWGEIAWPKYLEHIVDVVLYLEWDRFWQYRFLRAKKNRFWPADEVGIFEMTLFGLRPVYDIKERIIQAAQTSVPGSVLTVWIDNWRPVIVNLEVLLNKSKYKYPQRTAIWIDSNRLNLVIAILERYLGLKLNLFDIFVNIPGERKFYDSGLDLALAAAIWGQYKNQLIDKRKFFIWEIWLGWQILPSKLHEKRIKEIPQWFEVVDYKKIKNILELNNILKSS